MNKEKVMNYRKKHILIIILALWAISMLIVARFQKVSAGQAVFEFLTLGAVHIADRFEKKDELVLENLSKATSAAFVVLVIAVLAVPILCRIAGIETLSAQRWVDSPYIYCAFGAVILRSAVFLILDRTPKNCVEGE
jgi:hypothetical protein